MTYAQLIYVSRPFGYDMSTLNAILYAARRHNKRNAITGALICREDIFLQFLEGPGEALTATYDRIRRDDRHVEVTMLWSGESRERQFPSWEMRHDPVRSWLWTPEEVWAGAVHAASPDDIRAVFARIAAEPYEEGEMVL